MEMSSIFDINEGDVIRVFFKQDNNIFECRPGENRTDVSNNFESIKEECKKEKIKIIEISQDNVNLLLSAMNRIDEDNWFLADKFIIEMYYQFGLIPESEYKKYKKYIDAILQG